jgi:uncharacterized protein YdhG (YjbR/CyaY superfamily)
MAKKRPTTIPAYIKAAPPEGRKHLSRMYAILKGVAPKAKETFKWGTPFFVEPRFLFAFSAHKKHCNFAPMQSGLDPFRKELKGYKATKFMLQCPYDEPLPEKLIRKIARHRVSEVRARKTSSFW